MKYLKYLIVVFNIFTGFPILAQIREITDVRGSYSCNLVMAGNASYSVRRMILKPLSADQLSGGISNDYATKQIATYILSQSVTDAATQIVPDLVAMYQSLGLGYIGVAYTVVDVVLTIASANNTQSRNYFVYAPADGMYSFDVWIPGGWDQPCSMIKISSINDQGIETLRFNYDQVAVSDRVIHRQVFLPKGLCHINVSVGSGTLKLHTAGNLQLAMLDNPTPVQWDITEVPVSITQVGLLNYLPTVGSQTTLSAVTSLPPTPSNILDGTVSYSNIHPLPTVFPQDAKSSGKTIHIYGEPTEETLQQLGSWEYLHMKAAQIGSAISTSNGGSWTITRLPDYTTRYTVRAIFHQY